ncbi:MAG TPA: dihydrofolate reductase family protein [Longimicrobium sp.]|nr:dihydrofolate reductase family protein [Longimicrobium sp.]
MRRVRYNVAASLDGYIAGPGGEFDWIPNDPTVDFAAIFAKVDTVLLGRHSFELTQRSGEAMWAPGTRVYVFSRTLRAEDHPGVTLVAEDAGGGVAALRAEPGGARSGCSGAASCSGACSRRGRWIPSRSPSCRSCWAGACRCCRRPRRAPLSR